jgi:hypothetical protein
VGFSLGTRLQSCLAMGRRGNVPFGAIVASNVEILGVPGFELREDAPDMQEKFYVHQEGNRQQTDHNGCDHLHLLAGGFQIL